MVFALVVSVRLGLRHENEGRPGIEPGLSEPTIRCSAIDTIFPPRRATSTGVGAIIHHEAAEESVEMCLSGRDSSVGRALD